MDKLPIAVHGAGGRMGRLIVQGVLKDKELALAAALESANHPDIGRDIGELCGIGSIGASLRADLPLTPIACVIDFSVPEASLGIAKVCASRGIPLLVATTGFSADQKQELIEFHHDTALLMAPNCSLVVALLMKLVRESAEALKDKDFDVEIIERHHRFKTDAPSGTALQFAETIEQAMGLNQRRFGREGMTGQRSRLEIGIHAVRTGDNVGEHTIVFSTLGETMELVHKGHSRESYARGAIAAAKFLATKRAGLYSMANVLGF